MQLLFVRGLQMNTYALLRQLFKYNNMQRRHWMGAITITNHYPLCDNHVQFSHHIKPKALAFEIFTPTVHISSMEKFLAAFTQVVCWQRGFGEDSLRYVVATLQDEQ